MTTDLTTRIKTLHPSLKFDPELLALYGGGHDEPQLHAEQDPSKEEAVMRQYAGATFALLKKAHQMIRHAEEKITAQEKRIDALEALANCDELTGLQNRRGFFEAFMKELDRCETGESMGGLLLLLDIDDFKDINDEYGHMAGDACLRLVARTLQKELHADDFAARISSDEFVVLLSDMDKEHAATKAQNLVWELNRQSLSWYKDAISLKVSMGIKTFTAGSLAEDIFNAADMDLYACKRKKQRIDG